MAILGKWMRVSDLCGVPKLNAEVPDSSTRFTHKNPIGLTGHVSGNGHGINSVGVGIIYRG